MRYMRALAEKIDKYIYYMLLLTVAVLPLQQELAAGFINITFLAAVFVACFKSRQQAAVLHDWEQWLLYALMGCAIFSLNFSGDKFISAWNLLYVGAQYGGMVFVMLRYARQEDAIKELGQESAWGTQNDPVYRHAYRWSMVRRFLRMPRPMQLIGVFLSVAVLVSALGVAQKFVGAASEAVWSDPEAFPDLKIRVYSTLVNPNILAGYLVLVIAYCSAFFHVLKEYKPVRYSCLALGLLSALCLLYTYSRGNWLACASALLIFAVFYCHKAIIPILGVGFAGFLIGGQAVLQRVLSIAGGEDTSAALRMAYLEGTLAMIEEHPWGVGWYGYRFAFPDYNFYLADKSVIMYHCHNLFLNVWAELGYPGFLLFVSILIMFIYNAARLSCRGRTKWLRAVGTGYVLAATGICVGGLTDHIYFNTQMGMLFWFLGALVMVCRTMNSHDEYW